MRALFIGGLLAFSAPISIRRPTFVRGARGTIVKASSKLCRPSAPTTRALAAVIVGRWRGDSVGYWAVARLEPHRERLALHCLDLEGFKTYLPRLREWRRSHGRRIETRPPLFPGYAFFVVEAQWHAARWSVGVLGLIMDGLRPARVSDSIIAEIRARERGGLVELPKRNEICAGEVVRIMQGAFGGHLALYAEQRPHERVLVLLELFGGQQRVELVDKV